MSDLDDEGSAIKAAAMDYATRYRWRIVPLRARTKIPLVEEWQRVSSSAAEMVEHWWRQWPTANCGVQLGPRSGIIDVECDSQEAEQALLRLLGDDMPVVPTFQGKRGKHRLFAWQDGLPDQAFLKVEGIEIRLGGGGLGAQSVFPPSVHPDGMAYRWLVSPEDAPLVPMPPGLLSQLEIKESAKGVNGDHRSRVPEVIAGVKEGNRNEAAAVMIGRLLADLADPHDNGAVGRQWHLFKVWNSQCGPPLDEKELRKIFDSILKKHRDSATAVAADALLGPYAPLPPATPGAQQEQDPEAGWRVVIVESRPRTYRLYSSHWPGYITIPTVKDYRSSEAVAEAAQDQADHFFDAHVFAEVWHGKRGRKGKGLAARLFSQAEHIPAPPELVREKVVAMRLRDAIDRCPPYKEGDSLHPAGNPRRDAEGNIVFSFSTVWEELRRSEDKVTRPELLEVLGAIGAESKMVRVEGKPSRRTFVSVAAFESLSEMISPGMSRGYSASPAYK